MTDHQLILIIAGVLAVVTSGIWFPLLLLSIIGITGLVATVLLYFATIIEKYFWKIRNYFFPKFLKPKRKK